MPKSSSSQPVVPFAGRAPTAREAAFGRPTVAAPPLARKSTLHTVPSAGTTAAKPVAPFVGGRSPIAGRGRGARTAPQTATATHGDGADIPSLKPLIVPRVVTDQRIVVALVLVFLCCVIVLLSVNMNGSMRIDQTRTEMTETFRSVHTQQQLFRMMNSRFATWPELKANGASLPMSEAVRSSRADSSHWFLSLVDKGANMICDRTGELWDESPDDRTPICRKLEP